MYTNCIFLYSNPKEKEEGKDEAVIEQPNTSSKKRRQKKKIKTNSPNINFIDTETVSKTKIMNIAENNVQNNSHISKNDERDAQKKNVINKNEKQKRENKLKNDSGRSSPKKMKIEERKDSQTEINNVSINVENNGKIASFSAKKSTIAQKKNKNKNSQLNKTKTTKRKLDDPIMFLEAERLKTYGINAKKLINKLKYSNKKF